MTSLTVLFAGGGTGGHLYPALAIARAVVKLHAAAQPIFVGARRGIERDVLPTTEFRHELLDLHPLYRSRVWENWRTVRGAVGAWRRIGRMVRDEGVRLVVGTGGYASGVALGYAAAHRIPLVLQEQNSYPGLTVRFFSRYAREVYLGFPEAAEYLPASARGRAVATGNPIAPPPSPRPSRGSARAQWGLPPTGGRVILVSGGSQGSAAVNAAIDGCIAGAIPPDTFVIWATGKTHYERHRHRESERVRVRPYISPMTDAYAAADLAVGRAGAMTTAELAAWGIPAILIPLPTAAADHQTVNARALEAAGAAVLLPQSELTAERLAQALRDLVATPAKLDSLAAGMRERARPNAAEEIARRIVAILGR